MAPKTRSVGACPTPKRNAGRQPWSQEELNRLAEAIRNKIPRNEIFELMKPRTEHAVEHKLRGLKAEAVPLNESENEARSIEDQIHNDIKHQVRREAQDQVDNWTDERIQNKANTNEYETPKERSEFPKPQIQRCAGQVVPLGNSLLIAQAMTTTQSGPAYSMDLSTPRDMFLPDENGRIDTGYGHVGKNNDLDETSGLDFAPMVEPANTPSGLVYVGANSDINLDHM